MVRGQKKIPQSERAGPFLEVFDDRRVRGEASFDTLAYLLGVDCVGGDTFFFNELFDLEEEQGDVSGHVRVYICTTTMQHTISNVFFARSLTKGKAILGILALAVGWAVWLPTSSS